MSAALAPSPWPAPPTTRRDAGWRFGREQGTPAGWCFDLRRHPLLSRWQWLAVCLLSCGLSLVIVAGFWRRGITGVGLFAGFELLAVGAALWLAARHAGDRELITLDDRELAVEQTCGPGTRRTAFRAEWVRVEPVADDGSLVELSGQGRSVRVGRHVRPELRVELAQELRRALRLARPWGEPVADHDNRRP